MPILALLKLIPLKDWLYCGIIAALLAGFGVYTIHERHVGAQRIELADQRAVAAETARNKAIETAAVSEVNVSVQKYQAAVAAPTLPAPRIVCHAANSGPVPGHAGSPGAGDDRTNVPESTGPSFDPAEHVLAAGKQADAQVTLLQDYVKACQTAGVCKK